MNYYFLTFTDGKYAYFKTVNPLHHPCGCVAAIKIISPAVYFWGHLFEFFDWRRG